ncbi:MAG: N-acetylglutamate synthase, CG3035 family [Mycobacterium sp.]
MDQWPAPGTRVAVRYRMPHGSIPPLTDVVGHLVETGGRIVVRHKSGDVVTVEIADVVSVRPLPGAPVRNPDIRRLEHAAALAWPGTEQQWQGGWLLRAGDGYTHRANSAVPLGPEVEVAASLGAIIDFYRQRGLPPLLACPDRLVRLPEGTPTERENLVLTRDLDATTESDNPTVISALPDDDWLRLYERDVAVEVLTAVVDGQVAFASLAGSAVGRAAVTTAPDGTRWVGLSAVHVTGERRRHGYGHTLCEALLAWGVGLGARRAYLQVLADNAGGLALSETMGFTPHHRTRYTDARQLSGRMV